VLIDTQTHYLPPAALALLRRRESEGAGLPAGLSLPLDEASPMAGLQDRLSEMDRHGITTSVLAFAPVGVIEDRALAADLSARANDGLRAACVDHPGRFVMLGVLPLPHIEAASRELERIGGWPQLRGLSIVAQTTLYRPDEIGLEPLLAHAADLGLAVVIHPPAGVADLNPAFEAFGLGSGLHAMTGSSLVAARLILSGLLDRIPDLDLIVTHLGGVLPWLADRLDSRGLGPAQRPFSAYLRDRLWFDACGATGPALRFVLETLGPGRLLLGSDWPSRAIAPAIQTIRDLALAPDAEASILGGAAARWFDPAAPRKLLAKPIASALSPRDA
jgi:predicted TIM-barrel fold metal-dependent hydrolase